MICILLLILCCFYCLYAIYTRITSKLFFLSNSVRILTLFFTTEEMDIFLLEFLLIILFI